jgi:hypothetical protein
MTSSMLTITVSIGAVSWFAIEALWTRAKTRDGYCVYCAPKGLRILYFSAVPAFIYGAIVNCLNDSGERWVSLLLLACTTSFIYAFPATILVSQKQIMSVRWFGIKTTKMDWREADCIYLIPENNSVVVQDKQQRRIVHTAHHIDRAGFIEQVRQLPNPILARLTVRI